MKTKNAKQREIAPYRVTVSESAREVLARVRQKTGRSEAECIYYGLCIFAMTLSVPMTNPRFHPAPKRRGGAIVPVTSIINKVLRQAKTPRGDANP